MEHKMTNILYVEDNEDNIYMLSKRLKKKGFAITIAKDGEEGLKAARELKPDLILMDLSLPLLDGWEATKILKSEPKTKLIPVIALSAHAMQEHKDKALEAGCDDYDTKPVDITRLLSKINNLIS
jgi:CheY-like chemotaxis protein